MLDPQLRSEFNPDPDQIYLDAATYGLPPLATTAALREAIDRWERGTASWVPEWDQQGERCRALFAELIGTEADWISLMPSVSPAIALIAVSLPKGSVVIVPDDEFSSVLNPLLVAEIERSVTLKRVPFDRLAESVGPGVTHVFFSLVRSQDGGLADLASICQAASTVGAQVVVDSTHATPFVDVRPFLYQISFLICHGYKHLLCPRGVAFFYVHPDRLDSLTPWFANWRTSRSMYEQSYGGLLDLPPTATRFDITLAWHAWVGAAESLGKLVDWQRTGALEWPKQLAGELANALELPRPGSTIISLPVNIDADQLRSETGICGAGRAGRLRLSTHLYNTQAEVGRAAEFLQERMV